MRRVDYFEKRVGVIAVVAITSFPARASCPKNCEFPIVAGAKGEGRVESANPNAAFVASAFDDPARTVTPGSTVTPVNQMLTPLRYHLLIHKRRIGFYVGAAKNGIIGFPSEREALVAALVLTVASVLIVVCQFAGYWNFAKPYASALFWVQVAIAIVIIVTVAIRGPRALLEKAAHRKIVEGAVEARNQVEQLFQMTDMLQSAIGYEDANVVLRATAANLLVGLGGALYIFNNSRDRLDLSTAWDWPDDRKPPDAVAPLQCWALKRGKPHVNRVGPNSLRCEHHAADIAVLEIPMMARGEVSGLLMVQAVGLEAEARLSSVAPLAGAIADAMSLALSNIALREKLRTQALRDPLTGLYNRRYMEDVLERYANLAERNGSPFSAIMIDLDHFKRLNDEHGHALGDAVLREVAAVLVGGIRPCDVACRYGGEELVVLLPDCGLDEAVAKGEVLRARVESLSENHGTRITASFGVATIPDCSAKAGNLLSDADAALYRAKQEGRNRVVFAPRRSGREAGMSLVVAAE